MLKSQLDQTRSALLACEARFYNIINKSPDGIVMVDENGAILFVNPAAEALFDQQNEELLGAAFGHPVLADEKTEIEILRRDGSRSVVEMRVTDSEWEGYPALLAILRDITERKQAEDQLKRSKVKLEDANQEMEAFIYSVSHDLKNPLRTTSGFLRMLLKKYDHQLDEEGRNLLARIEKSAVKMNNIIDDLLRLSQIARQEIDLKRVNLTKMAETIIAELRFAQPRKQATILIREGLSAVVDRRFIEIALTNLLGNAWKYTEKKNETLIEFGMLAGTEGDGQEVFFIKDNGAGFDVQRADKMFKPFQRLHAASEFEGTGIGLAIVERVIRRLGGRIWAEGVPEQGAVFYFTLAGVKNCDR